METLNYSYRMLVGTVMLLIGGGIFSRLMYVRIRLLLAGRAENRWDLLAERAGRLMKIAIGQKKMFKEPGSGVLHALTFWGFSILAVREAILFVNIYFPEFGLPGMLGSVYDFGKDITELIVIAAIAGFFYIRLIKQPKRIHYSFEALLILGFIAGIMITDLFYDGLFYAARAKADPANAEAILHHISAAPVGSAIAGFFYGGSMPAKTLHLLGEANYWVHLLIIVVFTNLLPVSKHFHVITALPNVFLSRLEPKGALTLIDNIEDRIIAEESLGLGRVEDLSWKQTMDLYTCTECGRCTVNCPAWNTDKPLNPALLIKDLQSHLYDEAPRILAGEPAPAVKEGTIPPLIAAINPDAIWACTTCRSCSEQCPVMIEHVDKIIDMRRHMMLNLNQFPPELKVTLKNLENKSNPWGISSAKRGAWAKKRADVPDLKSNPDAEWLYFVGCAGAYDDRAKKVTEAVVKILNRAKVDFAIIGKKEKCSGDPARRMGHEYLFQEQATANIELMNKAGVKKVIASCPHCFNAIKNEYPQLGGHFEVVHHTQLIWRLVREGKLDLKNAARMKITFHDSCYLGRYNDEYDAPREALKAVPGLELVEMERSKQLGMCCGAGGARMYMEETIGTRVNQLRVEQAMETKPEAIVVSCPFCLTMVKDGLREKNIEGVETLDVAEVIANALVEPAPEPEVPASEPTAIPAGPKDD